ncbi:MAG TPA: formylglycine-generating enzyme family protein [Hymenobacter sp.]
MRLSPLVYSGPLLASLGACSSPAAHSTASAPAVAASNTGQACCAKLPTRFVVAGTGQLAVTRPLHAPRPGAHLGMVWVPGGSFRMGAADKAGRPDEYPQHPVAVPGFWMDATEVTNAEFARFVAATGYVTTAEKAPDWAELQKQLPPGTPKPADSVLVAASLVFTPPAHAVPLDHAAQWWRWQKGASWRHPGGPGSNLKGRENYPVVQVSWDDAVAYARWAGKRLPNEAEWEFAARAGLKDQPYTWGSEPVDQGRPKANTWQGHFPDRNTSWDKFARLAPAKSFPANGYGLYDLAGNVWEWCADWYRPDYYQQLSGHATASPAGPSTSLDPDEPTIPKRVVRGGSFLCNATYCSGYRVSARMKSAPDTGLENTGFRCVADAAPTAN